MSGHLYRKTIDTLIKATPSHPFYDVNLGWIQAKDLTLQSKLFDKGNNVFTPSNIDFVQENAAVYNFEVMSYNNYFVGLIGWLVHNKCAGEREASFKGKLKGEDIELPGVKTEEIIYTKRDSLECKQLRDKFNSTARKDFLEDFYSNHASDWKGMEFSETDILKLKDGQVPAGYQVHHKLPLDDGGTNNFSNLILIKNDPYHKAITNFQNSVTRGLRPGESINTEWPIPSGGFYNGK